MPNEDPAVALAVEFEGFSATPYLCPAGVWTIGYGTTRDHRLTGSPPVGPKTPPVTPAMALGLAHVDLQAALTTVQGAHVTLTANQTAALEDFTYNLGPGNFLRSNVLACIRRGDYAGAARHLTDWDCAHGVVLAGLLRRRVAERELFLKA